MSAMIFSISLKRPIAAAIAATLGLGLVPQIAAAAPLHGLAMNGAPALPADFDHFPYTNPDAPKGGTLTYGVVGTFDSLNPFIVQGAATTARGIWDGVFGNNVFESLLMRSRDEPFTMYGLLAETVETPDDRSWVEFHLNPKARWSDGQPVTVDDVIFTAELLRDKGRPNYRSRFAAIDRFERVGERGVRMVFKDATNRELPLLIALSPVLPRHATDPDTFDKSTLTPMIGSGPYLIAEVDAPQRIILRKNPDYWASDLPSKRGFDNFDEIRIDYYREANTLFEAFKAGRYDINPEGDPARWESAYDFPAVRNGDIVKEAFSSGTPKGMRGLAFNTRRAVFADMRVRQAIAMLFDFEWVNQTIYHGVFSRNASFFQDSDLSALGRPVSERERQLLAPFADEVDPLVMDGAYIPSKTDGSGNDRAVLRDAVAILNEAGYELRGDEMVNTADGKPLAFELMTTTNDEEKIGLAFQRTLARVGIVLTIRPVDAAQYESRRQTFDFDMVQFFWSASLSPGAEQDFRWSSKAADTEGTFNLAGVKSPAVDAMIAAMLAASESEDFVAAIRALDRVLMSGHYVVPLFYLPESWVAYRSRLAHPPSSLYGAQFPTWWARQSD